MKHLTSFLIKLAIIFVVLWVVLGYFYGAPTGNIIMMSIILSIITYLGDVFILPNVSNFWATLGDFGLSFVGIWVLGQFFLDADFPIADASLISAFIIALAEVFYHRYLRRNNNDNVHTISRNLTVKRMQTEFSSELDEDHHKR